MSKKSFLDHFWTTKDLLYIAYLPYLPNIGWPCGGGQIWPLYKIGLSDTQKGSNKWFFGVLIWTKVARNLILMNCDLKSPSWDKNWRFGMGGQIWPPPHECVGRSKTGGGWGVIGVPPKTKNVQNYYVGIVKKFQNNRLSHFLMV